MPLPVIPNCYRIALPWQDLGGSVGVRPVNVIHVSSIGSTASAVGSVVAAELVLHGNLMFDVLYTGLTLPSINVLALDGVSAGVDVAVSPSTHGGGGGGVLPQVAAVVSFHTGHRGSQGRGRCYVGPMGETQVDNGHVTPVSAGNMLTAWQAFQTGLNAAIPNCTHGVASYKHAAFYPITNLRLDSVCGTQRRRQNQLR